MEAKSIDKKTFQLTDNGQQLGELTYESIFSHKAEIKLANSDLYEVKPVGIFGTSITVTKNGAEIVNLKMNWRGQIVFAFEKGQEFIFKAKSSFINTFIIEDKAGEKLLQFDPKFNWSRFTYNYDILFDKKPEDMLFVLLGIYASNYYLAAMSGQV
jgi:hypothetical protein